MKSGYRETETQQLKKPFPKDDNDDDDEGKVFRKFPRGLWGKFVASITSKWTPEARYSFCSVWKRALTTELTHTHKGKRGTWEVLWHSEWLKIYDSGSGT